MSAPGEFRIALSKEDFVFAAAHFITFAGHRCETLHGHNYRASVRLAGALDPASWYVVDFSVVKKILRRLTDELDHKVLLPTENPIVTVAREGARVAVGVTHLPLIEMEIEENFGQSAVYRDAAEGAAEEG